MSETPQTKPADGSLRDLGISFVVLIGGLGGLLYISAQTMPTRHPAVTFAWDASQTPSTTTEVWSTKDSKLWTLRTNATGNQVTILDDYSATAFRFRSRLDYVTSSNGVRRTNSLFSGWTRFRAR